MGSGKRRAGLAATTTARGTAAARTATLTEEVQSLRRALEKTEHELQVSRAEAKASATSLRTAREQLDRTTAALTAATDAQTRAEQAFRTASAERARIETALRFAEAARHEAEADKKKAEQALGHTKTTLSAARGAVDKGASEPAGDSEDKLAALEAQLRLAGDQGARAAERIAELEQNLEQARQKTPDAPAAGAHDDLIIELKRKARVHERRLHLAEAETVAAQRKVAELQQRLAEHSSQLTAIAQRNRRIHELKDDKASLEAQVGDLEKAVADTRLRCPRCAAKMIEFEHHGVTLDRCLSCDGLYFDAGELEQVIAAEYPAADEAAQPEGSDALAADEDTLVDGPRGVQGEKRGFFRTLFKRKSQQMAAVTPPDDDETDEGDHSRPGVP